MAFACAAGMLCFAIVGEAQTQAACSFSLYRLSSGSNDVTQPFGVNDFNNSVGQLTTEPTLGNFVFRGFTHFSNGSVSLFTAPHSTSTTINDRNDAGTDVGTYFDTITNKSEGFVLHGSTFVSVAHPNAPRGTSLRRINKNGVIIGAWFDSTGFSHGFRLANGAFKAIQFPNSQETSPQGINDNGEIVGWYTTPTKGFQGFTFLNGVYHTLNFPNQVTELRGISDNGIIVGLNHATDSGQSFLRKPSGVFKIITVPNSFATDVTGISANGSLIVGRAFLNSDNTWHGFTAKCQ